MAKNKGTRILITLECTDCRSNLNKRSPGVSRYSTQKNRRIFVKLDEIACQFVISG